MELFVVCEDRRRIFNLVTGWVLQGSLLTSSISCAVNSQLKGPQKADLSVNTFGSSLIYCHSIISSPTYRGRFQFAILAILGVFVTHL